MCHRQKTDKMAIPKLAELTWGVGMADGKNKKSADSLNFLRFLLLT
jgi:hypothetical protein